MAIAKVTIEALTQMANTLRQSADDILATKEQMDRELYSIPWDDPIGLSFIGRYEEDFKPLKEKLIPSIEDYIQYMNQEGMIVSEYSGESTGGWGIGGAVGASAMGVGIGIAGATKINSNPKKADVFPDPLDLIAKDSPAPPPSVFETDKSSIRAAAAGLLEEMTEKDLFIDSNEMQNRLSDKTDEIFRNKYNRSLNEIGIDSGFNPETSGYYDDYNKISEELRKELVEMKEKFEPTPIRHMDNEAIYSELSPEDRLIYDDKKNNILERKENAEFRKKIADIDAHYDGWEGVRAAKTYDSFRGAWAVEEIAKSEGELQELEKWAKETVRKTRNQRISEYIKE